MDNKIEKIRQKIERLYDGEAPKHDQQCDFDDGYFVGLDKIAQFIDSLESEKPISQDGLEKEISTWIPAHISGGDDGVWNTKNAVTEWAGIVARHFAEWGAENLRDSEKMISKDLEDAVDGIIVGDIRSQEDEPHEIYVESAPLPLDGKWKMGDKVRIVILPNKEEK